MRGFTAIVLLLLMLAVFLAPAALATATTTPLPACCRASGAHHCSAMAASMAPGGVRILGQSCPHRKPVACTGCAAPPAATETVALADARAFFNEFFPELFVLHREPPQSQRAPPQQSSLK